VIRRMTLYVSGMTDIVLAMEGVPLRALGL
jgi:hypothetical protein